MIAPLLAGALTLGSFLGMTVGTGAEPGSPRAEAAPDTAPRKAVWQLVVEGPADPALPSAIGPGVPTRFLAVPLAPDGRFGIEYRHSVQQTPVIEWFQVEVGPGGDGPRIVLRATEYHSFGAGLPTEAPAGARFRHLGDRFLIEGLDVPVPSLVVRPLALTQHVLIVGEGRWALSGLASEGAPLRVYVEALGGEGSEAGIHGMGEPGLESPREETRMPAAEGAEGGKP